MKNYKEYFKGKRVTIMGLGLLGGALNDAIFLAECGAELTITDLKSSSELRPSLRKLGKYEDIKFVLGEHKLEDFKNRDFILQPGNVPPNSPYLLEAQKNNIPIHESESLFFANSPEGIRTIGVTGTRGKTTTTKLIYEILKTVPGKNVYLAGNIQGTSTLALLKKVKSGDTVIMELDSWCLHGLGEAGKSPNIAVFTNFMKDHLNFYLKGLSTKLEVKQQEAEAMKKYFTDKAQIYLHQTKADFLICGEKISKQTGKTKSFKITAKKSDVPKNWKIKIPGDHNLENIACAIKAVEAFSKLTSSVSEPWFTCKKVVENFTGVEGRLQFLKNYKGIKIYNDTTATTPDATIMALRALQGGTLKNRDIILICGGADKGLDMSGLLKEISKYCKEVFLLDGTGSAKLNLPKAVRCASLKEAVEGAITVCKRGDILLFSPAFASFGMFANEYDRGDKFNKLVNALK